MKESSLASILFPLDLFSLILFLAEFLKFDYLYFQNYLNKKKTIPMFTAISSHNCYFISFFMKKRYLELCTQLCQLAQKGTVICDTKYKGNLSWSCFGTRGEVILIEPYKLSLENFNVK